MSELEPKAVLITTFFSQVNMTEEIFQIRTCEAVLDLWNEWTKAIHRYFDAFLLFPFMQQQHLRQR